MKSLHLLHSKGMVTSRRLAEIAESRLYLLLSPYFDDVQGMLESLDVCGGFISGSWAINFFAGGGRVDPADIDFYLPWETAENFAGDMELTENFKMHHFDTDDGGYGLGLESMYALSNKKKGVHVNVMQSKKEGNATYPIAYFWSPMLMNIVSPNHYSAAYPSLIAAQCAPTSFNRQMDPGWAEDQREKWENRGYRVDLDRPDSIRHSEETCPSGWRYFGDKFCLTGRIGEVSPKEEDEQVTWRIGGPHCWSCSATSAIVAPKIFLLSREGEESINTFIATEAADHDLHMEELRFLIRQIR